MLKPHYSSEDSLEFWQHIKSIKSFKCWEAAYAMGVMLQDLEESVLEHINKSKKRKKKKEK